jgi:hypothetical protein
VAAQAVEPVVALVAAQVVEQAEERAAAADEVRTWSL